MTEGVADPFDRILLIFPADQHSPGKLGQHQLYLSVLIGQSFFQFPVRLFPRLDREKLSLLYIGEIHGIMNMNRYQLIFISVQPEDKSDPLVRLKIQTGFLPWLDPALPLTEKIFLCECPGHILLAVHMAGCQILLSFPKAGCHSLFALCLLLRPCSQPYDIIIKCGYEKLHI